MAAREERRRTATGKFRVRENEAPIPHEEGFRRALDDALKRRLRPAQWPAGTYENVRVEFAINMKVVNPGSVIDYIVTLTSSGPTP
jgi:hypothetical protein